MIIINIEGNTEIIAKAARANNWINRCPAVKLAVNRTPNANGRISKLIVSIIIRAGIKGEGVPSGNICANDFEGCLHNPVITVVNQNGIANDKFKESWVVGVNVYGKRPKRFIIKR